jgi:cell division septum initiation protein DivIVA
MTDERTLDRLLAHLRAQAAEARRLELEEADRAAVQEHQRLVLRLQQQLAYAVRDLLAPKPRAPGGRHLPST